jgi:hypothetical protein
MNLDPNMSLGEWKLRLHLGLKFFGLELNDHRCADDAYARAYMDAGEQPFEVVNAHQDEYSLERVDRYAGFGTVLIASHAPLLREEEEKAFQTYIKAFDARPWQQQMDALLRSFWGVSIQDTKYASDRVAKRAAAVGEDPLAIANEQSLYYGTLRIDKSGLLAMAEVTEAEAARVLGTTAHAEPDETADPPRVSM